MRFMLTVRHYFTEDGRTPFLEWMHRLRDLIAKARVVQRLTRVEAGNFGDHRLCREGVWALRIDQGAGYRLYYAMTDSVVVLLLCAGDKNSQNADIERAIGYWNDWQRRNKT